MRCGSQSTGDFAGRYVAVSDPGATPSLPSSAPVEQRKAAEELAKYADEQLMNFEIHSDRITSGVTLVQEFCLTRVLERTPGMLRAEVVWHEDVHDPGDASLAVLRMHSRRRADPCRSRRTERPRGTVATVRRSPWVPPFGSGLHVGRHR